MISIFIIVGNLAFLLSPEFVNSLPAEIDDNLINYATQSLFGFHIVLSDTYNYMFIARCISFGLIVLAVFLFGLNNIARISFIISQCLVMLGNGFWTFILFGLPAGSKGHIRFGDYLGLAQAFIVLSFLPIIYCIFFMLPEIKQAFGERNPGRSPQEK
jgi:hypothetical protein